MIKRHIESDIKKRLFKGKAILIIGPRQTGKTTLARMIFEQVKDQKLWMNGDEPDIREILSDITSTELKSIIGKNKLVVIDEAQRIKNVGLTIKLAVDTIKDVQIIATGSSALDLSQEIKEPLTGRKYEYTLLPFSFGEMCDFHGSIEEKRLLQHRMIYGYYPEVVNRSGEEISALHQLSDSYLYKDILLYGNIKRPAVLEKLLKALALQVGSEVSFSELGSVIGVKNQTVEKYVDLLEKAYVIFKLPALSRNVRNEIKKGKKIYFYDNGIRNAIINNFNQLTLRSDLGPLWENFLIGERKKFLLYQGSHQNSYFWRTTQQQEIDYIEEKDGKFFAYEFKWKSSRKAKFSQSFLRGYPDSKTTVVTQKDFNGFLSG